ncbi:hypothetical protein R1flu_025513 [Riccia fluitans]|uniref:Uncharacterized protein n=1 Tax=Riccia fluitans TaxID=41844 RepID=A0ABD1XXY9_9MARC
MEAEEGVTEAEGGVPKSKAGNMEGGGGVTEAEAKNMEAEGGVTEPHLEEAADCEERVTEAREVAREMECVVPFGKWDFEFQKKLKGPKFIYVEAKKKDPTVIYSHLVRAMKIRMASMAPMGKQQDIADFSIDIETHEQILAALSESEAPPFEKV